MSFHDNAKVGYLVSRLGSDANQLQNLLADTLLNFFRNVLIFFGGCIALLFINWKLAIMAMLLLPFYAYSVYFFSGKIRYQASELQEKIARAFNTLYESLYNITTIKAFCLEEIRSSKVSKELEDSYKTNYNLTKLSLFSSVVTSILGSIGSLVVLWYGGSEIIANHLTLGGFVAFNAYLGYLYGPVLNIVSMNQGIQTSLASLKRVFSIFDMPTENSPILLHRNVSHVNGEIVYNNVSFSYDGNKFILRNISFKIKNGEKIAIVGKSGSGKSTLIKLLIRFYSPQSGDILIDEVNINNMPIEKVRRIIGVVLQDPMIFSGTIGDNIRIGKPDANKEELVSAAKIANLYEFILSLPKKFETEVGDRGVKLSGGERQRLAIARVVLKKPSIIVFDEATSEIDSDSEKLVHNAMEQILEKRTVIFIAHRLFSVMHADKILLMEDGEIHGYDCHEELYKKRMTYRKLCDEQLFHTKMTDC
jgi:ABC-type multidrug transport system fused ATPase/permease subunit